MTTILKVNKGAIKNMFSYDKIVGFMKEYFPAYSEKGQIAETQHIMDKFYAPDVRFDEGIITSREQWYRACLSHPAIQDKISLNHLFVDERQQEAGALVTTQAIERKTGKVLVEIKMNALYSLKADEEGNLKIAHVRVFLESNPNKGSELMRVYGMKI